MKTESWRAFIFRATLLTGMVACFAYSLADFGGRIVPEWNATLFVGLSVLVAIETQITFAVLQRYGPTGPDPWRVRLIEVGVLFVVARFGPYLGQPWATTSADLVAWSRDLTLLIADPNAVSNLVCWLVFMLLINHTHTDFAHLGDPPENDERYVPPADHLLRRFFGSGAVLLVITGLIRMDMAALLNLNRPPLTGLSLNVLLYFVLGLIVLGQAHYTRLTLNWQQQGLPIEPTLSAHWRRSLIIFLVVVAALAFALPTGFTLGPLNLAGLIIAAVMFMALLGLTVSLLPVMLLLAVVLAFLAWLFGVADVSLPPTPPPAIPTPLPPTNPAPPSEDGSALARSILVWVMIGGMVVYLLSAYWRDRPELAQAAQHFKPLVWLRRFWAAFRQRAGAALTTLQQRLPPLPFARWRDRVTPPRFNYVRLSGLSPRDQIRFHYQSLLRRAKERGLEREAPQTPTDYARRLQTHLPEAQDDIQHLTASFIEARYTQHPLTSDDAHRAHSLWAKIRARLRQ